MVLRYNGDGSPDDSFDGDGIVTTRVNGADSGARAVAIQTDGKIVVTGHGGSGLALVRYNPDGSLDTSFSDDGTTTVEGLIGYDVAIDANDRIVVAGPGEGGSLPTLSLARVTPGGRLDTTFGGGDGKVTASSIRLEDSGNDQDPPIAVGLAIQVDGKPVFGGLVSGTFYDFGVARFTVAGALDPSFSGDGAARFHFNGEDYGADVAIDVAGNIVVAGTTEGSGERAPTLVRYLARLAASACPGLTITNTVAGTPGDDTLVGTPGSDFIYGLAGNDTITGGGGKDCIYGGTGDDILDGGDGKDRLFGEAGNDTITGGTEVDKTEAGPGDDTIRIAAGDVPAAFTEVLKAMAGNDTVELVGPGLTAGDVTGSPPTFTVTDPVTGGTYSAVKVEVIADT